MPIYEYSCSKCGLKFELLRAMSQSGERAPCPSCGGRAQRVLSLFSRSSEGSPASGSGSACASCSATTCSSCPVAG
jgi:putative FmdB family regulatory protein